jgi:ABC-2 type transport system ATP-binding protein
MDSPIVKAEHVIKTFGETIALNDVSLSFEQGIIYGLLGPNGAGKTTLIRILTTLIRPDSGSGWVDGVNVLDDPRTARTRLGLAGQFAAVDEYLTGRENVEMVGRLYNLSATEARRRAAEVLERIDLGSAADRTVRTYSGGMRRRLDLAASMVGRPRVLFLDEPTTGIDPRSRIDIWALIRELVEDGTTILMTTQYLDEADQLAAQIGVIDRGHLIAEGTPEDLKDRLGGSVVEVVVDDSSREQAVKLLSAVNGHDATFDAASKRITLPAPKGAETLMAAVRSLDGAGITPNDITLRRPTLDDVFLAYTGKTVEEEGETTGRLKRRRERRGA